MTNWAITLALCPCSYSPNLFGVNNYHSQNVIYIILLKEIRKRCLIKLNSGKDVSQGLQTNSNLGKRSEAVKKSSVQKELSTVLPFKPVSEQQNVLTRFMSNRMCWISGKFTAIRGLLHKVYHRASILKAIHGLTDEAEGRQRTRVTCCHLSCWRVREKQA